jgi:gliding motility-associated-like protein
MKRSLLFLSITTCLFYLFTTAAAQITQTVNSGAATKPINFPGVGCVYSWVNTTPGIGLAASGTGNIPSFIAVNKSLAPVTAIITGLPVNMGPDCNGTLITYSITVNPVAAPQPAITAGTASGTILACAGMASVGPAIQQFTVSGTGLTGNITAIAPQGFEISLDTANGYSSSLTLTPTGDSVSNTIVYVRSAASALAGSISGNVVLASPGAASQNVAVTGTVNALPTVNPVSNQTINNGAATTAVNFTGTGKTFTWTNNTPGIGLAASGTGNIPSFTAINTGSTPVTATVTVTPASLALAYIPNFGSDNVSVINTATGSLLTTVNVGRSPFGVSVSPDGSKVYISNSAGSSVSVISTANNNVVSTIVVGLQPNALCISPDGGRVYVSNSRSNTVSVINTATNLVTATVFVGKTPFGIALSPDGSRLFVVNSADNTVSVVNTATNAIISTIQAGSSPYGIAVSPDGGRIYVANENANTLAVFNTATNVQLATIAVGTGPYAVAVSPDGSLVYVSDLYSNAVSVISAVNYQVIANIHVGGGPGGISVSSDGGELYVANTTDNTVSVINTATNTVISTIPVGYTPIAFGNFIAGGTGCSGIPVAFTVTVNPASLSPDILSDNDSYSSLTTVYGTPSPSESFNVAGTNLTAGISVTAPAGFEVSTDNINFGATVMVGGPGNIPDVPVYIRLAATTPVGVYNEPITLSSPGAHNLVFEFPVSTVTPAPLTITADNKSKLYGQVNPVLTVTYTGFVNYDGPAQLTANPLISTTAVTASPPGEYPITASGAISPNYNFTYVNGVLRILADTLAIVIPNTFTPNGDGINDTWDIKLLDSYPNCTVNIYNRYGENVYSSVGYGIAWNGTYRGAQLPQGTYYYIINLNNGLKVLSGSVTIIR